MLASNLVKSAKRSEVFAKLESRGTCAPCPYHTRQHPIQIKLCSLCNTKNDLDDTEMTKVRPVQEKCITLAIEAPRCSTSNPVRGLIQALSDQKGMAINMAIDITTIEKIVFFCGAPLGTSSMSDFIMIVVDADVSTSTDISTAFPVLLS